MEPVTTSLRERVYPVLGRLRRRVERWTTDLKRGIRTRGVERWGDTSMQGEARPYEPVSSRLFETMAPLLPVNPAEYAFIDLGAGKGAAVVFAAEHGFRRSIGVELSEELFAIADRNKRRLLERRPAIGTRMELLNLDAQDYEFPDEPTVVYMYNSFGPATLSTVLRNIDASLAKAPRPLYLLYVNPVLEAVVNEFPGFRMHHRDRRFLIYGHATAGPDTGPA